eukprot:361860-Chlamydomonas_euryale.AAC.1
MGAPACVARAASAAICRSLSACGSPLRRVACWPLGSAHRPFGLWCACLPAATFRLIKGSISQSRSTARHGRCWCPVVGAVGGLQRPQLRARRCTRSTVGHLHVTQALATCQRR